MPILYSQENNTLNSSKSEKDNYRRYLKYKKKYLELSQSGGFKFFSIIDTGNKKELWITVKQQKFSSDDITELKSILNKILEKINLKSDPNIKLVNIESNLISDPRYMKTEIKITFDNDIISDNYEILLSFIHDLTLFDLKNKNYVITEKSWYKNFFTDPEEISKTSKTSKTPPPLPPRPIKLKTEEKPPTLDEF